MLINDLQEPLKRFVIFILRTKSVLPQAVSVVAAFVSTQWYLGLGFFF